MHTYPHHKRFLVKQSCGDDVSLLERSERGSYIRHEGAWPSSIGMVLSVTFRPRPCSRRQRRLGLLEDLGFVDKDVLEGEDFVALVSDLFSELVGEELLEEVLEGRFLGLVDHDLLHLLSDLLDLGGLGVASSLNLTVLSSGEGNGEKSHEVAVV